MRTGGGDFLRGNLRRRQNRDCDNQAKTSGGAMHNLFSGNYLLAKTTTDVISPGHLGKTSHVDKPESGVSGRPLFENDDRSRLRRIAESMAEDECRSVTAEFTPRIGVEHPNFTRLKLNP